MDLYTAGDSFGDVQRNSIAASNARQAAYQQSVQNQMAEREMQMRQQQFGAQQDYRNRQLEAQQAYEKSLMEFGPHGRQGALFNQAQLDLSRQALELEKQKAASGETPATQRSNALVWQAINQSVEHGSFEADDYKGYAPEPMLRSWQTMSDENYRTLARHKEHADNMAALVNEEHDLAKRDIPELTARQQALHQWLGPNSAGYDEVSQQLKQKTGRLDDLRKTLQPYHADPKALMGLVAPDETGRFQSLGFVPPRKNPPAMPQRQAPLPSGSTGAEPGAGAQPPGAAAAAPGRSLAPDTVTGTANAPANSGTVTVRLSSGQVIRGPAANAGKLLQRDPQAVIVPEEAPAEPVIPGYRPLPYGGPVGSGY